MRSLTLIGTFLLSLTSTALGFETEGVRALEVRGDGSVLAESQGEQFEVRPVVLQQAPQSAGASPRKDGVSDVLVNFGIGYDTAQSVNGRIGAAVYFGNTLRFVVIEDSLGINGNKTAIGAGLGDPGLSRVSVAAKGILYKPFSETREGTLRANIDDLYGGAEVEVGRNVFFFSVAYLKKLAGNGPGRKQGASISATIALPVGTYQP